MTTHRLMKHASVALLLGLMVIPASQACYSPPREQIVTPDEQIAMATDVSVAKVIRATPAGVPNSGGRPSMEYEFEVQQRLRGFPQPRFVLPGAQGQTRPAPGSNDHSDAGFWERGGARLHNDPDCVLRPDFTVGEYYLVFRGKPATWRSFEHIETVDGKPNPNDKWLMFVKEKLKERD